MKITHEKTIIILYIITLITAVSSRTINDWYFAAMLIVTLSALKFFSVAFQFMDMKHANSFWKSFIIIFLLAFTGTIGIVLNM